MQSGAVSFGESIWFCRGEILLYSKSREDEVILIKNLISGNQVICPKCGLGILEHFHKKAKKSNVDYKCNECGERYQIIKMIDEINNLDFNKHNSNIKGL